MILPSTPLLVQFLMLLVQLWMALHADRSFESSREARSDCQLLLDQAIEEHEKALRLYSHKAQQVRAANK